MSEGSQRSGFAVSGAMHLMLLAVLVFGFSRTQRFDDAPESIPVETITSTQLNQIMEGEKTGKPAPAPPKPAPPPPQTTPAEPAPPPPEPPSRPPPPNPEPPPPEPPKRPETPPPPAPAPAPVPPQRPEPPPKPQAQDAPTPPTKPRVVQKQEDTPRPPEKPRTPPKPEEPPPRPPEKPRVVEKETPKPDKFKPDDIAKALAKDKAEEKPHPKPPAYDQAAISKMIGQSKTAEASPSQTTPQGLANHHAERMSVSLENALNEWFRDSYKNCWNLPPSNPSGENYVFDVRVTFNADGSLSGRPVMLNPPHDPEWRAHADSVMRAVMRCNPLHIPSEYAPYFDQWRTKVVHFDPSSAEG